MRRVTEEFGGLVAVLGCSEEDPAPAGLLPSYYEEVFLQFRAGRLSILAVSEDDSIDVGELGPRYSHQTDLSGTDAWRTLLGATVLWTWSLTNHQGYLVGFQMEFTREGQQWDVQFMVEASRLNIRGVR